MHSTLSPTSALFLANVNRAESRLAEANNLISSGRQINVASDAPDQIDNLLQLRANRQRNTQIQSNLTIASTDAQAADNALTGALTLMDRAIQLAAQGAPSTQTADARASLAQEVASIQTQMVSYSQTQVAGRFIFSGDSDDRPYYELNLTPPPDPTAETDPDTPVDPATLIGANRLLTSQATRQIEDPAGGSFSASKTAQEIFDDRNPDGTPASDNAFAALNNLRYGLLNNDSSAITSAVSALQQASTHLNTMQAYYGTVENRIDDANTFATKYDTQLQTEISNIQDADIPSAAIELSQASTQLQAAFEMQGKMPMQSLFNYLG